MSWCRAATDELVADMIKKCQTLAKVRMIHRIYVLNTTKGIIALLFPFIPVHHHTGPRVGMQPERHGRQGAAAASADPGHSVVLSLPLGFFRKICLLAHCSSCYWKTKKKKKPEQQSKTKTNKQKTNKKQTNNELQNPTMSRCCEQI